MEMGKTPALFSGGNQTPGNFIGTPSPGFGMMSPAYNQRYTSNN